MGTVLTNIHTVQWKPETNARGQPWSSLDLSGEHLGVHLEALPPGDRSSTHHYHTLEEEHVLILEGAATLVLGSEEISVSAGDHFWFPAGKEEAHHLENRSNANVKFLVFGERCAGDVVVYPGNKVMLVKALGWKQFTFDERKKSQ